MNYQNLKTKIKTEITVKILSLFAVLVFGFSLLFFSTKSSSQSLPDCSTVSGTAQPGNNCLFYGLPLCRSVPSASYSISSQYVLVSGQSHRSNCADLSDLPLCNQVDNPNPGKNCVKECSDPMFTGSAPSIRGQDYAVHNRDCIRFCDAPEEGIIANPEVNCTGRKCHQLAGGVTPNSPANCNLLNCNLLTPDELKKDNKFDDDSKKYCEGNTIKCFNFTLAQLPYVKVRSTNTMCQLHNCRTASETCTSFSTDDVSQILNKGQAYVNEYQTRITSHYDVTSGTMCIPLTCKPVLQRQYRCEPQADSNPTTRNSLCDSSGSGASCSGGYCYKTIDCNLSSNNNDPECAVSVPSSNGSIGSSTDTMRSWFYRPKPMDKSYSSGTTFETMTDRGGNDPGSLCYTIGDMNANGWGWWFKAYMHDYSSMSTRSPQMCGADKLGSRGLGYLYLCGTNSSLYSTPDDSTAFHKGYVRTDYTEGDGTHSLVVCLRYNNAMIPQRTCGSRECGITCFFGLCTQVCGFDECRELTIHDSSPRDCEMNEEIFGSDPNKSCMSTIDTYVRVRAVKYGNRICTFLDLKGTFAYYRRYFNGSEKLSDGTCISGTNKGDGTCENSKDTNNSEGLADVWRTLLRIPYIQNNRSSGPQGYLDRSGQLFNSQECIQVPYRLTPPRTYNLANFQNSTNMFSPPLYVLNSRAIRGGIISLGNPQKPLGPTDFHYPELELKFGTTTKKLSLGIGYNGFEISGGDPLASATITTIVNGFTYTAEVFVKKEYNDANSTPIFCLYRKLQDANGVYLDPLRVECIDRNLPEINNKALKVINPSLNLRSLVIYPDVTNAYNSSRISLRYLSSTDINSSSCNSSNTACNAEIKIENPDPTIPDCNSTSEKYKVCAQRDECSRLNVECIKNEIDFHLATISYQPTDSFATIRRNCNEILLPICNSKKGLETTAGSSILNPNPSGSAVDSNAYGWFNEICFTEGFNTKLKNIVAYTTDSGVRGKCLINPTSPYLNDGNSSTNCDEGGKAPNCLCIEAVDGVSIDSDQVIRQQTPHEAGLCVDMPLPQTCPAIDYNLSPNPDQNDPEYIASSVNQTEYGANVSDILGKVHISHKYRTEGKPNPNGITLKGHAEFPVSVFGMNDVRGECKGFWRNKISVGGTSVPPKLNCIYDNGTAYWEEETRDECVRFQCPEVYTAGPEQSGIYQGAYGAIETGENKGLSHGFALWPSFTKTNDFSQSVTANSCITGFKKAGALATTTNGTVTGSSAVAASLYNLITGYSGGTLPTRQCNQLGQWQNPSNACQRIVCPAVSPPTPSGSGDTAAWELWRNAGGATFPAANASRSDTRIQTESVSVGTCNNSLGFFQAPGGSPPTRECDHLGNWSPVTNACVTQCDAIVDPAANNSNNGFGYWNQVLNVSIGGEADGVFTGCISGYYVSPYPPIRNKYGQLLTLVSSGANYTTTIPDNIDNDTRTGGGTPQRICKSIITAGGAANVWTIPSASCVNTCPGYNDDPRIGAGVTKHPGRNGTITLNWPTTNFGQYAYLENPSFNQQDASHYAYGRTNGYYSTVRYCNPTTHKWDSPVVQCITNSGSLSGSNLTFNNPTGASWIEEDPNSAGSATGSCLPGYYTSNYNQGPLPRYACSYKDGNKNIDEVYFRLVSGQPCMRYCQINSGQQFGNSTNINTSTGLIEVGGQVPLACNDGYGNTIVGGTHYSGLYHCGRLPNDRTDSSPYVVCTNNGWSSVYNNCEICRGCSSGSPFYDSDSSDYPRDATCTSHTFYKSDYPAGPGGSASHNQTLSICRYSADIWSRYPCGSNCNFVHQNVDYTCRDSWWERHWGGGGDNMCDGEGWRNQCAGVHCSCYDGHHSGEWINWD